MKFLLLEINRIVYIWARYSGLRDATEIGKHYSKSDLTDLIERLTRFRDNPELFIDGFEKEDSEK